MKIVELFAGYGSQALALRNLGIEFTSDISEIDKYAIKAYNQIHGKTRNYGDITKIESLDYYDLWTYSFPCQDLSFAGKKAGIKQGTRSGLLYEVERLLEDAVENNKQPKYMLLENVKALVSKKFMPDFQIWLNKLDEFGYNNYWQVLNAKDYGIPQNRERVFVISIRKDVDTKGYKFPSSVPLQKRLKDMLEPCVDEKYYLSADKVEKLTTQIKEISNTIRCGGRSSLDGKYTWDIIAETFIVDDTQGFDGVRCYNNYSPILRSERSGLKILEPKVIQIGNIVSTGNWDNPQRGRIYSYEGCSPALNCVGGGGLEPKILEENIKNYRIRKLTARECFRLMGVKDEQFDRLSGISNSQLYKLAGNSIVVNVLEAIFRNLFIETNIEKTGQLDLF